MSEKAIANARRLEDRARELQREGKYHEAEEPLLVAMSIWKLVDGPDNIEIINDEIALAASYRRRGDVRLAIAKLEHAVADEPPEDLMLEKARLLDNLVGILTLVGEHSLAEKCIAQSVAIWTELRGPEHLERVVAILAAAQMRCGRLVEARANLVDCEKKLTTLLGANHPMLADQWLVMAELAFRERDGAALAEAVERCLSVARSAGLADHHPTVVRAREMLNAMASPSPN